MRKIKNRAVAKKPPLVHGEYSGNGYAVWIGRRMVYAAGNHVLDSTQPATSKKDCLQLKTIRQFCQRTAKEIAAENGGRFVGVERMTEAENCLE